MLEYFKSILYQFNSREYALLIWIILGCIFMLLKKNIRKSLLELICSKFLLQIIFIITSYNILITYILYKLGFWNISFLKDSLYWFLGTSLILSFNINNIDKGIKFIKKIILEILSFTAIFTFIGNIYTFSFWIELILQPIIFFLILLISFIEFGKDNKPEYQQLYKILNYILGLIIFIFFIKIVFGIFGESNKLFIYSNIIYFLYPLFYAILFFPFLYLLRILMIYESLFIRVKIKNNTRFKDLNYVNWAIFKLCGLNLTKLKKFSTGRFFYMENKYEINKIINDFNIKK